MRFNEKDYSLKLTGLTLLIYKEEFGRDLLSDINELQNDYIVAFKIVWAMAKAGDESFPAFRKFMGDVDFATFDMQAIVEEMKETINNGMRTTKQSNNAKKK